MSIPPCITSPSTAFCLFKKTLTRFTRKLIRNQPNVFMKLVLLGLLLIFFTASRAQKEIKLQDLKEHIGDNVKVQGKISGIVVPADSYNQKPTFIYVGGKYPKEALTIFVSPGVISQLHLVPCLTDIGNTVWVSGKVEKYKGKARIIIRDPQQLDIVQDMQGELE
jgi:hypothetical protein